MMTRLLPLALFAYGLHTVAMAQTPKFNASAGGPPARDAEAIAAIEQVLKALGGKQAQLQIRSISIQGTVQTANSPVAGSFVWEDDFTGAKPEFRKELHEGDSVRVFASGHGSPAANHHGAKHPLPEHTAVASPPLYLPGVVLANALRREHISAKLIPQNKDSGGLIHIQTSWDLNAVTAFMTPQDWYFDPNTFLPVRVDYRVPETQNAAKGKAASMEFSDFRNVSGVTIPFHIVSHGPDGRERIFTVTSADTNPVLAPRRFEANGGGQ
jgi:hypothetical protein